MTGWQVDFDARGRVLYRTKVGVFTVEPTTGPDLYRDDPHLVKVWYGTAPDGWHNGQHPLPDAPVIFRVTLLGAAVFNPDKLADPAWHSHGLPVRREGGGQAPSGTRRAVGAILRDILTDWRARPDLDELRAAHARFEAPARLASARRALDAALARQQAADYAVFAARDTVHELATLLVDDEDVPY